MTEPMATDEICPSLYAHGETHHVVPRREGKVNGEPAWVQTCQYCGATYRNGAWVPLAVPGITNTSTRRVR